MGPFGHRVFLSVSAILSVALGLAVSSPPIVDLGYAKYQGTFNETGNTTFFVGVRYAAPPTGTRRFQAPALPAFTPGVQLANSEPSECFQTGMGVALDSIFSKRALPPTTPPQDEDCLFLNVWTPGDFDPNAELPVVVWIHGGGYCAGSMATFDGADLIRDSLHGAIAVTIQYRLGIFGFLPGSEVKKNGALNAGLLDQNLALQWVQSHISKFGGDPQKVTIWGESAGAGSVLQHVVAHGGRTEPPLFRAALSSSLYLPFQYNFDDPIPEKLFTTAVQQAGCSPSGSPFACLQDLDVQTLENINNNISQQGFFGTFVWVPVVDGSFIQERPLATLASGRANGEVVLAITNSFEGTIFVEQQVTNGTIAKYISNLVPTLNAAQVDTLANAYLHDGFEGTFNQAVAVMSEVIFVCPTHALLNTFKGRSFKGEFAIPPGTHGSDVAYYFDGPVNFPNPQFIASFSESFFQVTKVLNPNGVKDPNNITPKWNLFVDGNTEMLFNMTSADEPDIRPITTDPAILERCQLWFDVAPISPQ